MLDVPNNTPEYQPETEAHEASCSVARTECKESPRKSKRMDALNKEAELQSKERSFARRQCIKNPLKRNWMDAFLDEPEPLPEEEIVQRRRTKPKKNDVKTEEEKNRGTQPVRRCNLFRNGQSHFSDH